MSKIIRQIPLIGDLIAGPAPVDAPPLPSMISSPTPTAEPAAPAVSKAESAAAQAEKKRALNVIRARARTVFNEGGQSGLGGAVGGKKKLLGE